jgi:S-adenosylmethionine synthetase
VSHRPERRLFTSESVTEGHPDKICDLISDTILDAILAGDPDARVAVETMVTTGLVHVAGEVMTSLYVEIPKLIRELVRGIGYTSSIIGFDGDSCGVSISIGQQSPDIAAGVEKSLEARAGAGEGDFDPLDVQGAGDQGLMFGYASDETPSFMPVPIWLAHRLAEQLARVRKSGEVRGLRPDGKTQVTIEYDGDRPVRLDTVVISTQHDDDVTQEALHGAIREKVVEPILAGLDLDVSDWELLVNPAGQFIIGGPKGDAGLTGRKIIVDTYGGMARHGGGAFSGKDPSKVDRSASYAMRWVAKNVVAAKLARRCEVQVAYAIGRAHPVGLYVETFGTEAEDVSVEQITHAIRGVRPSPGGNHPRPRPPAPDLRPDVKLRALRARAARVHLGADGPRTGPVRGSRAQRSLGGRTPARHRPQGRRPWRSMWVQRGGMAAWTRSRAS